MALRAKKPEAVTKRLKLFMFGPAGVGKTTAAIQFPNSYIIDAEKGTENYDKLINGSGGQVFQTSDIDEVVAEVRTLHTERHDFRTLVIDPITPIYDDLVEKAALKVGTEWGRHYQEANRQMKRLIRFVLSLDMNVIMTAHGKAEYDDNMRKTGQTFDGWRKLDYLFDLVLDLSRKGITRKATVRKTRIEAFPDQATFDWSYTEIVNRYGKEIIERPASMSVLATPEQVGALRDLLEVVKLPDGTADKWLDKAGVDTFEDMSSDAIQKCIDFVKKKLPNAA